MGAMTTTVELLISNPVAHRFELEVDVLSAGPNRVPIFPPIVDQTVMPGDSGHSIRIKASTKTYTSPRVRPKKKKTIQK